MDIEENVSVQGDDLVAEALHDGGPAIADPLDDDEMTEVVVITNGTPAKANWTVDHEDSGERTVTLVGAVPRDLHVTFRNPEATIRNPPASTCARASRLSFSGFACQE